MVRTSKKSPKVAKKVAAKQVTTKPVLLSGGNPQIAKGDGDDPVQAYIAANGTELTSNAILSWTGGHWRRLALHRSGRLRDEFLNETLFTSLAQARTELEDWRHDYNTVRPHSRIGWLTPAVHASNAGPQRSGALSIEGSTRRTIAPIVSVAGEINRRTQVATG